MKVLVANRGEIAVRVLRACRELGLTSVAVYSEADREALHIRYADEALLIGPAAARESYLSIPAILEAARRSEAEAVHPGYGFLSENAGFAQAVEDAGMVFIGPKPKTLALTGDKLAARKIAREVGLPVLPGPDQPLQAPSGNGDGALTLDTDDLHFPLLVKAVAGGGGRGIRMVNEPGELAAMIAAARREAQAAFGDDGVYLEPLVSNARHIEVQILGDGEGHVLCLGDRECSIQRRRQKLIEEAPAPGLSPAQRTYVAEAAARLGGALAYRSLGTVEFLLGSDGAFHFIEINPRIQVEHPVTEMVTGVDLVREQLRLAAGCALPYREDEVSLHGAAIEARVLAEDPAESFMPTTGEITYLKEPGGPGVRVDSALYQGMHVTTDYDSLLAKVIAWGDTRVAALLRLRRALGEFQIGGVVTDLEFLKQILHSLPFIWGEIDTTFLDRFEPKLPAGDGQLERQIAAAVAMLAYRKRALARTGVEDGAGSSWRTVAWREQM